MRSVPFLTAMTVLAAATLMSLSLGAMSVPFAKVLQALLSGLGLASAPEPQQQALVLGLRLPRAILGAAAGGALASAGAALQALFRNPLADPGVIGVSNGAALAAAAVLVLGTPTTASVASSTSLLLPLIAFAGGVGTTWLVYRGATFSGHTSARHLLLTGIAINALAGAATGMLVFLANDAQLRSLTFWMLGSLGNASWATVATAVPWMLVAILLLPRLSAGLDALLLGEAETSHLGFDPVRLKRQIVLLSALAVGSSVAVSGVIGFVGLMVPHFVRLWLGPQHQRLLPISAALGGALLLFADVGARTVAAPAELPIGILTALLGGPFLLEMLRREQTVEEH